jgi:rubrerythrin
VQRPKELPATRLPKAATVDELLAIARGMEAEAVSRYETLAEEMARSGNVEVADVFRHLAADEREHVRGVALAAERLGRGLPEPASFRWAVPEALAEEAVAEAGGPRLLTPRGALALAVLNEERAFAFYVGVASTADNESVRRLAEDFAKEELGHLALLRLERRRAWRAERKSPESEIKPPRSLPELLAVAGAVERRMADAHAGAAEELVRSGDAETAALIRGIAEEEQRIADELAARTAAIAPREHPVAVALAPEIEPASRAADVRHILETMLRQAEERFEFYTAAAEQAKDEGALRQAQQLSEPLIRYLALISARLSELETATQIRRG